MTCVCVCVSLCALCSLAKNSSAILSALTPQRPQGTATGGEPERLGTSHPIPLLVCHKEFLHTALGQSFTHLIYCTKLIFCVCVSCPFYN